MVSFDTWFLSLGNCAQYQSIPIIHRQLCFTPTFFTHKGWEVMDPKIV
jgi:hypothetical protein